MDNVEKKNEISSSSLVDLKAELLRKKEQFKKERLQNKLIHPRPVEKKATLWSKKNAGVLERAQRDLEEKEEEDDVMVRSRSKLAAKAQLYEKMTSKVPDEEISDRFLVDFETKAIDNLMEKRQERLEREREQAQRNKEEEERKQKEAAEFEEEMRMLRENPPETEHPEEEWVDFIDSFGRSRRCMQKDLPELKKMDKDLENFSRRPAVVAGCSEKPDETAPDLMSQDMYREQLRQQWEAEQQEAMQQDSVHYSNVQFNDRRAHGVGFYQFAKQEEERQKQMEELKELREQTMDTRSKKEGLKDKRKAILEARLAKVRQRRMLRDNTNPFDDLDKSDEETVGPQLSERVADDVEQEDKVSEAVSRDPEPLQREDTAWRRDAPVREWDKGKKELDDWLRGKTFTERQWMEERRSERLPDFAPPQTLYGRPMAQVKDTTPRVNPAITTASHEGSYPQEKDTTPRGKAALSMASDGGSYPQEKDTTPRGKAVLSMASDGGSYPQENESTPRGKAALSMASDGGSYPQENDSSPRGKAALSTASDGGSFPQVKDTTPRQQPALSAASHRGLYPQSNDPVRGVTSTATAAQLSTVVQGKTINPMAALEAKTLSRVSESTKNDIPCDTGTIAAVSSHLAVIRSELELTRGAAKEAVAKTPTVKSNDLASIPLPSVGVYNSSDPDTVPCKKSRFSNIEEVAVLAPPAVSCVQPERLTHFDESPPVWQRGSEVVATHSDMNSTQPGPVMDNMQTAQAQYTSAWQCTGTPQVAQYSVPDDRSLGTERAASHFPISAPQTQAGSSSSTGAAAATIKAPQPAHFSSAPSKTVEEPGRPRYQRVNLHELPLNLPAPPTASNIPQYQSQEEIFGSKRKNDAQQPRNEQDAIKYWHRQFDSGCKGRKGYPGGHVGKDTSALKPANIPFASPFIQKGSETESEEVEFDSTKPPPPL